MEVLYKHKDCFLGRRVWPTELTFEDGFKLYLPDDYMSHGKNKVDSVQVEIVKLPRSYTGVYKEGQRVFITHFLDRGELFFKFYDDKDGNLVTLDKNLGWYPHEVIVGTIGDE